MKIIIATGGSGGHVFPALGVAQELRSNGNEVVFVITRGMAEKIIEEKGFDFYCVSARGAFGTSFVASILSLACMIKALCESLRVLKRLRPGVVAGFGGYGSFSTVFAAWILRYPTIIHEQNVIPGKANRLLSKVTTRIAISFDSSRKFFKRKKTVLTGCPCHSARTSAKKEEILKKFNFTPGKPIILALGGSQGSSFINDVFLKAAVKVRNDVEFQVIHITGKKDYDVFREKYKNSGISHYIFDFCDTIEEVYEIADLAISRAGASTISELDLFQLPAIIIPYPYAGGHQKENAHILHDTGLATIIEEKDINVEQLEESIKVALEKSKIKKSDKPERFTTCLSDAAISISKEIIKIGHEK